MVVERRRFGNSPRPAGEEGLLYGVNAVEGWLLRQPQRLLELFLDEERRGRIRALEQQARERRIPLQFLTRPQLAELTGDAPHQGVAARVTAFPYRDLTEEQGRPSPLWIVVDQLQDPRNLGAVIRSAAAAGAGALVLPQDRAAGITPAVEVAAAGACAILPVVRVVNTARALGELKEAGFWVAGLSAHGGTDLYSFRVPERVALVVGGETGLRDLVLRQCDFTLTIPMAPGCESLNASVAAAVALFELRRQQQIAPSDP